MHVAVNWRSQDFKRWTRALECHAKCSAQLGLLLQKVASLH